MPCASCGSSLPPTPFVRAGLPTVWSWPRHSSDLVAVPTFEAIAVIEALNGPVS